MQPFTIRAHQIGVANFLATGLFVALATTAEAACLSGHCSQNGLTFDEASNNFRITDVTGQGTVKNPFVVYQDVWGLDISLAISNLSTATQHSLFNRPGFAIRIVSRNLTGAFWQFYDHELQERAGYASSENDGLSFAQGIDAARPYTSSHYNRADEVTDVRDFINFYQGGGVNPEESVQFNYVVTDTSPTQRFYIRQRPDYRTNAAPISPPRPASQPTIASPTPPILKPVLKPSPLAPPASPSPVVTPQPVQPASAAPQPVPEPSTAAMGILAFLFARAIKLGKQFRQSKQLFEEQT